MKSLVVYIHGKGGSAEEAEHYKPLFPKSDVIGFDYKAQNPWDAKEEFQKFFNELKNNYALIFLIANSIGAFFALTSLNEKYIDKAYFISPIVDMERLIKDMMSWAKVTENELFEKGKIETDFGEKLSWEYLCYVRNNPINWSVPTYILYGDNDNLTSLETISAFVEKNNAELTIMKGGEHWFHTEDQMKFLDNWILNRIK